MSSRTCPDWPLLMEQAPDLQFKHYTLLEAKLPAEALVQIESAMLGETPICCDLDKHVYNPAHTDPQLADALRSTHWFPLEEWAAGGPGAAA